MPNLTVDPQPQDNTSSPLGLDPQRGSNPLKAIFIGILIFVLLSVTAYGAYWYGQSVVTTKKTSSNTSPTEKVSSFSNVSSPKPTQAPVDETANWKTYSSILWRISFKYPLTTKPTGSQPVKIIEDNQKQIVVGVDQTDMAVFVTKAPNPSKLSPLQWWQSLKRSCRDGLDRPVITPTLISGQEAITVSCVSDKFVYANFKDQMFALEGTNDQTNGNLFLDQILSTFRFD